MVLQCTWINLLAILQDLDSQEKGEHELVSLKQAAADIVEEGVGECLIQIPAALFYTFSLQYGGTTLNAKT